MNKLKLFLTIITLLIAVTPITVQVIIHRNNPVNLILPPTFADLIIDGPGDISDLDVFAVAGLSVPLPTLIGTPVISSDNTVKLIYNFTNPLDGKLVINSMDAEIVCTDHSFVLGTVFIEPTTLEPHETHILDVIVNLTPPAIEHIITHHKGQNSIHTEFRNYSVDLMDIKITMPHRHLGDIQIPQSLLLNLNNYNTYR
jgi:hypothetical protein